MLKTILFLLFGCSLYFGQNVANTASSSNQNNSECTNCTMNLNTPEGDGTKATSTSGQGSGTLSNEVNLNTQQVGSDLYIYLMPQNRKFTTYTIYDLSGNLKKEQQIHPTNSYSINVSNLSPGNYLIYVEVVSPNVSITKLFNKQ